MRSLRGSQSSRRNGRFWLGDLLSNTRSFSFRKRGNGDLNESVNLLVWKCFVWHPSQHIIIIKTPLSLVNKCDLLSVSGKAHLIAEEAALEVLRREQQLQRESNFGETPYPM